MFDFSERKDLLVIIIIGFLIVIAAMIFAFIVIWSPKEEAEFKVGVIDNIDVVNGLSDEYKANQYVKRLSELFKNNDYEKLYSYVAKDYITYSNMTVKSLENKIKDLKLDGQEIYLESCTTNNFSNFLKIYALTVRGKSNDIAMSITVREKSPRQFEIAFDEFISYNTQIYEKSAENVKLEIISSRFTSRYSIYKIKLTNNNRTTITLNNKENNYYIALNLGSNKIYSELTDVIPKVELAPGEVKEYDLIFETVGENLANIIGITIESVKISNDKEADIFYSF